MATSCSAMHAEVPVSLPGLIKTASLASQPEQARAAPRIDTDVCRRLMKDPCLPRPEVTGRGSEVKRAGCSVGHDLTRTLHKLYILYVGMRPRSAMFFYATRAYDN